jgi:hypothetical protein
MDIKHLADKHGLAISARVAGEHGMDLPVDVKRQVISRLHGLEWLSEALDNDDVRSDLWEIGVHSATPLIDNDLVSAAFNAGIEIREVMGDDANKYHPMIDGGMFVISKFKSRHELFTAVINAVPKRKDLYNSIMEYFT